MIIGSQERGIRHHQLTQRRIAPDATAAARAEAAGD
jgi:hypothetical protein